MNTRRCPHAVWFLALAVLALAGSSRADGYRTSLGTGDDVLPVVVVSGTPYEMGRAAGQLLRPESTALITGFLGRAQAGDDTKRSTMAAIPPLP